VLKGEFMEDCLTIRARHSYIVAKEGWLFIFLFALVTTLFLFVGLWYLWLPMAFLTLFTIYFFRNPDRVPPPGTDLIISPADGKVIAVENLKGNIFTENPAKKISIFMSVFNVHVNRIPVSGKIDDIKYHPGKFLVASLDKASEHNERNALFIETAKGIKIAVVQIAGLVARRIVCYLNQGDSIQTGERLGLIKFGSRVDLYLPVDSDVQVKIGDKVKAGRSIIGRLS